MAVFANHKQWHLFNNLVASNTRHLPWKTTDSHASEAEKLTDANLSTLGSGSLLGWEGIEEVSYKQLKNVFQTVSSSLYRTFLLDSYPSIKHNDKILQINLSVMLLLINCDSKTLDNHATESTRSPTNSLTLWEELRKDAKWSSLLFTFRRN